jgi:hypothetical protein
MGDAIDLGPWPNETLEFIKQENIIHLKGNHEEYNCSTGLGPELRKNIRSKRTTQTSCLAV